MTKKKKSIIISSNNPSIKSLIHSKPSTPEKKKSKSISSKGKSKTQKRLSEIKTAHKNIVNNSKITLTQITPSAS
jgi:hypothetical protein